MDPMSIFKPQFWFSFLIVIFIYFYLFFLISLFVVVISLGCFMLIVNGCVVIFICFYSFFLLTFFLLKDGVTALHIAAWNGFEQIVKILIEHGSNVGLQTKVLIFFSFGFHFHFFVFLISNFVVVGSLLVVSCLLWMIVLCDIYFIFNNFFNILFLLKDGETALHFATWKGFEQIVKILVEHGSNIDIQTKVLIFFFFFFFDFDLNFFVFSHFFICCCGFIVGCFIVDCFMLIVNGCVVWYLILFFFNNFLFVKVWNDRSSLSCWEWFWTNCENSYWTWIQCWSSNQSFHFLFFLILIWISLFFLISLFFFVLFFLTLSFCQRMEGPLFT